MSEADTSPPAEQIHFCGAVQKSLPSVRIFAQIFPPPPSESPALTVPKTSLRISPSSSQPLTPELSTLSLPHSQNPSKFPSTSAILNPNVIFSFHHSSITKMLLSLSAPPEFQQDSLNDSPTNCAPFGLHGSMKKKTLCYNYAHSKIMRLQAGFRYFDVLVYML